MNKIKIAIIDDHPIVREGVIRVLSEFDEINILFEAENGLDMQKKFSPESLPDVILMDIQMPVMDGYAATSWVRTNFPHIHILALSMHNDDNSIIRMLRNGAGGYVLKESKPTDLVHAMKTIAQKGVYLNEQVTGKLIHTLHKDGTPEVSLTQKEINFIEYCCSELTYKEMAVKMNVSPYTVENYRESVFQKLQIRSRTGVVLYAIKNELVKI